MLRFLNRQEKTATWKMRQLIETEQRNLRALPIQLAASCSKVRELDFPAARPLPG